MVGRKRDDDMTDNVQEPVPEEVVRKRHRGIYLLPNLFTTGCLFSGFYAIIAAVNHQYENAAIAIFVAMVLDGLDGRVARMTHTESEFGVQYDSLADMCSFGLAPALVVYMWALSGAGKLGWMCAFIYAAGTALRLARFNTQVKVVDKRFFQGLPSPSAAAIVAGTIWMCVEYGLDGKDVLYPTLFVTVLAGLLMVSNFPYYSFKDLDVKGKVPFLVVILVVLGFAFVALSPATVFFIFFALYLGSGPVVMYIGRRRKRADRRGTGVSGEGGPPA